MSNADFFLKVEGVDGESTDDKHKGEIEIQSFTFGASNAASFAHGSGGGVAKVALQDLHITKSVDKSSAKLFTASCTGEHLKKATLVARKAGGDQHEYLTIVLSDVLVSNFTQGGHGGSGLPTDQVALAFSKIEFKYKEQKPDGSLGGEVIGGWDQKLNKKV